MEEAVKFAWAYLLTHGQLTNGEWSYYGSCWEYVNARGVRSWNYEDIGVSKVREKALTVGIDWTKTEAPVVEEEDGFAGTFASYQDKCLATLGTLYLKNGEKFLIGSSDDDAAHLAKTARELMKGRSGIQDLADKL